MSGLIGSDTPTGKPDAFMVKFITEPGFPGPDMKINENNLTNSSVNIYPNPSKDKVAIKTNAFENENYSLQIFNAQNQLVKYDDLKGNKNIIDISTLPFGFYTFKLTNDSKQIFSKFIIN